MSGPIFFSFLFLSLRKQPRRVFFVQFEDELSKEWNYRIFHKSGVTGRFRECDISTKVRESLGPKGGQSWVPGQPDRVGVLGELSLDNASSDKTN